MPDPFWQTEISAGKNALQTERTMGFSASVSRKYSLSSTRAQSLSCGGLSYSAPVFAAGARAFLIKDQML